MDKNTLVSRLHANYDRLTQVLDSLTGERFETPLGSEKWSPAQHAMHLVLSTRPLNKALRMPKSELAANFGLRGEQHERDEPEMVAFYRSVLSTGVVAPPRFSPENLSANEKAGLLRDLRSELAGLTEALQLWEEAELSHYLMPHPAMGLLTVREMMMFTVYHTEHHTAPIEPVSSPIRSAVPPIQ